MILNTKFKTSMCKNFEHSQCHMGDRCHFAHGKGELRMVSDPLPANTPIISDQKMEIFRQVGLVCLSDMPAVKKKLLDMGRNLSNQELPE